MSPDEVLIALESMGAKISRRTLLRYEELKLIPEAKRGGLGRGKGRTTDYPDDTVPQAYAAWYLLKQGYKSEELRNARDESLNFIYTFFLEEVFSYYCNGDDDEDTTYSSPISDPVYDWIMSWQKASQNIQQREPTHILITGDSEYPDDINFEVKPITESLYTWLYFCITPGVPEDKRNFGYIVLIDSHRSNYFCFMKARNWHWHIKNSD